MVPSGRACNFVKVETRQNLPPVLKIVTRTALHRQSTSQPIIQALGVCLIGAIWPVFFDPSS